MTAKLTLRLQAEDVRALDTAAEIIGGKSGAPYVGRTTIIRKALEVFNAQGGTEGGERR